MLWSVFWHDCICYMCDRLAGVINCPCFGEARFGVWGGAWGSSGRVPPSLLAGSVVGLGGVAVVAIVARRLPPGGGGLCVRA